MKTLVKEARSLLLQEASGTLATSLDGHPYASLAMYAPTPDSRDALLKGGASGPTVVPGKPAESLLIQAVRRAGELQMPPEGELTAEQIAVLEHWVERGAPWTAGLNAAGTTAACLALCYLGLLAGRVVLAPR